MLRIISDLDGAESGPEAVLVCTHAASLIAIGRALTGVMPEDVGTEDFKPYTCGLSKFVRRRVPGGEEGEAAVVWEQGMAIPRVDWRGGKGVAGGWDCVLNGDCSHLKDGAERGWHFSGDESFMSPTDGDAFVDDAETGTSGLPGARRERDDGYSGNGEGSKL
ncbi:Histidine phosphatase superfamily [Lasallia pustulata]|uniref:Histidine phosphatase superfamily n=1 Tax=Lasallia pustulata TaxID=136370 RepID=A0A1W5CT71_9LECA|nr:Histidine phosphatase superfamily [Lasallia pustulata]